MSKTSITASPRPGAFDDEEDMNPSTVGLEHGPEHDGLEHDWDDELPRTIKKQTPVHPEVLIPMAKQEDKLTIADKPIIADSGMVSQIRQLLETNGEARLVDMLGFSRQTLYRVLAGLRVQRGTLALIERALKDQPEAGSQTENQARKEVSR
jgi:hypothetical protein